MRSVHFVCPRGYTLHFSKFVRCLISNIISIWHFLFCTILIVLLFQIYTVSLATILTEGPS